MRAYVLMSLSAVSLVAACASSPPESLPTPDDPQLTAAHQYFETNVKPVFEKSCSNCHADKADSYNAPDYLGAGDTADYYESIRARTDFMQCAVNSSPLLLKGADPTHPGASFATADAPKIQEWLEMEAIAEFGEVCDSTPTDPTGGGGGGVGGGGTGGGGTGGGPVATPGWPPVSGADYMKAFGDCSTYTDWVDSGMPLVANQTANHQGNNTPCYSCHLNPQTGLNHMPDPNNTADVMLAFKNMRYMWSSFNLVRWTVNNDAAASFKDLVKSYLWRDTGITNTGHPTYTMSADNIARYEDWYSRVRVRYDEALASGIPCDAAAGDPTP